MRATRSCRGLAFVVSLAATGCGWPFASRPPAGPSSTVAPPSGAEDAAGQPSAKAATDATGAVDGAGCDDAKASASDDDHEGEAATLDDGLELAPSAASGGAATPAPLSDLTDAEIAERLRADIGALGPMSIGPAHSGVLVAGVRMPEGANWQLVSPGLAWGTKETVESLAHAIDAVAARFPDTPRLFIGDISAKRGGHLPPHVSHQSGRDVDVGYYLTSSARPYTSANASNLDRARTWHLVRTLIAETDVDLILIDTQIQRLLKAHALEIGEDPAWLDQVFQVGGKSRRPIVLHAKGHVNHMHVRFYSPVAQELGRRAYRLLLARRILSPPTQYITHTVKSGETLSHLALRYKVTTDAIKKANGLTTDVLKANKPYKIPQTGGIAMPARVVVPARRTPPPPNPTLAAKRTGVEPCRRSSL